MVKNKCFEKLLPAVTRIQTSVQGTLY